MISLQISSVDQDRLVEDFDYFMQVYNYVEENNEIPNSIYSKYMEGFFKFRKNLPVSNHPIPDWNPEVKAPSQGIKGMIERFASIFS